MNIQTWERCLSFAQKLHPTDKSLRTHHYAFILKQNKIIKVGWNKKKTHPLTKKYSYHSGIVYIHAELDVILKMQKEDLSQYSLLSIRVMKNGNFGPAKPCLGCSALLKQVGISDIYFT